LGVCRGASLQSPGPSGAKGGIARHPPGRRDPPDRGALVPASGMPGTNRPFGARVANLSRLSFFRGRRGAGMREVPMPQWLPALHGKMCLQKCLRHSALRCPLNVVHFTAMVIAVLPALGAFLWLERRKRNA